MFKRLILLFSIILANYESMLHCMENNHNARNTADTCAFCINSINALSLDYLKLSCGHSYHKTCLENYLKSCNKERNGLKCPMCRQSASPADRIKINANQGLLNGYYESMNDPEFARHCTELMQNGAKLTIMSILFVAWLFFVNK